MPMPPVSTSSKKRSSSLTRAVTRSRVTPAVGSTMAILRPASQLSNEDLPTLGRPMIATIGTAMEGLCAAGSCRGGLSGNRLQHDMIPPAWQGILARQQNLQPCIAVHRYGTEPFFMMQALRCIATFCSLGLLLLASHISAE